VTSTASPSSRAISLNNKPLPGKKGTLWEGRRDPADAPQISDHINNGNHIPLMLNHDMVVRPRPGVRRRSRLRRDGSFELRTLFYLDKTEAELAARSTRALDEVSISFLPTSTSAPSAAGTTSARARTSRTSSRAPARTTTGRQDGVHVNMVGLANLIELSLVARGAADKS
jgi:hypothetical protein